MGTPLQVVTLHADADAGAFQELEKHLAALQGAGTIAHTHKGSIMAGMPLNLLDEELRQADVVLCLLSADFLADQDLMERAGRVAGDPRVALVPVLLRQVSLAGTVFAGLKSLPAGGGVCADKDGAFTEAADDLRRRALGGRGEGPDLLRRELRDPDSLLDRVERICALREERLERGARIRRRPGPAPYEAILEVSYKGKFFEQRTYLIAALERTPQMADLVPLAALLRERYRPYDDMAHVELVHLGMAADEALLREAGLQRIELVPLSNYQGLINFERYVHDQTQRLERDEIYPPPLYVPQRMAYSRGLGGREDAAAEDALTTLLGWMADLSAPRFALVLGDFGVGKTFLLHELARRLAGSAVVPVLLELRSLEKAHSLDVLVSQHLARAGMQRIDLAAFRYLLHEGRIALLFDGFDELALRVSYDRAAEHLDTVAQAVQGKAKVVLTSRTQHFRSDDQVKTALANRVESLPGHHAVRLLPFDDRQIRAFLRNRLGDEERAAERFRLIEDVKDLLGLSHNPRMLSFIAQLPEERLRAAQRRGEVTAAQLYEELLTWWIRFEYERAHPPGIEPGLSEAERWAAVEMLAERLWQQTEAWIHVNDLGEAVSAALAKLKDVGSAAHEVGAGTLLCRDPGGRFSFIHQSVTEWLVARVAARQLKEGEMGLLGARAFSPLMADFFADLAGREAALGWARAVLRDAAAGELLKKNALLLRERQRASLAAVDLCGEDLRGRSFARRDLARANLRGADLRGVDLREADLSEADLRGADLRGAILLGADLRGARLDGARLQRARLVGAQMDTNGLKKIEHNGVAPPDGCAVVVVTHGFPRMGGHWHCGVSLSHDGTLVAAASGDGTVRLWDVESGKELRVLAGHMSSVSSVSFGADDKLLASGSSDKTVKLWDVESSKELRVLTGHTSGIMSVSFSGNGKLLASGSADKSVRLWDVEGYKELRMLSVPARTRIWNVSLSEDSKWLASGLEDNTVRLWDVENGKELGVLANPTSRVFGVHFSVDGKWIACGAADKTVRIWDVESGKEQKVLIGHANGVVSVRFSKNGKWLASGSADKTVRIWDVESGKELRVLVGHMSGVRSVSLSGDDKYLASGSDDNTVRLWEVENGKELRVLAGQDSRVLSVSFSRDGKLLASGSEDNMVRLWDVESGKELRVLAGHTERVMSVNFSEDGKLLASGAADSTVRLWEVENGGALMVLAGHAGPIHSVSFSLDGKRLASGSDDKTVKLWETKNGKELRTLSGSTSSISSVRFSNDGKFLFGGSWDKIVRLWEVESGKELRAFAGHVRSIVSITISVDGKLLASGSDDKTVRLWEVESGKELMTLTGHGSSVFSVDFSKNSKLLASGSDDKTVRLWNVEGGKEQRVLAGHESSIMSVNFSPDGRHLASASNDNTIRLWDCESGECLAILVPCAEGWAALTPDGRYKMGGIVNGEVWHAINLCRFELGELDPYLPNPLLLPDDHKFLDLSADPHPLSAPAIRSPDMPHLQIPLYSTSPRHMIAFAVLIIALIAAVFSELLK